MIVFLQEKHEDEFEQKFDLGELYDQYSEYIIEHSKGDRLICNGDTLVDAIEDQYLYEDFKDYMLSKGIES